MGQAETVQIDEAVQKADAGTASAEDKETPLGAVARRPFVLKKTRGSGGGNLATMLIVIGAIVVFGIVMVAFLSTKGTGKKRLLAQASKPNLGRSLASGPGGSLLPNNQVKPSPSCAQEPGTVDAPEIERTKSPETAHTLSQGGVGANASHNPRNLGEVGRFVEPNTAPNAQSRWTPAPYGSETSRKSADRQEGRGCVERPIARFHRA